MKFKIGDLVVLKPGPHRCQSCNKCILERDGCCGVGRIATFHTNGNIDVYPIESKKDEGSHCSGFIEYDLVLSKTPWKKRYGDKQ